jgi:hypothetical protein
MEKTERFNVYLNGKNGDQLRSVMINDKWRITKYLPKKDFWLFLNDMEYDNYPESFRGLI